MNHAALLVLLERNRDFVGKDPVRNRMVIGERRLFWTFSAEVILDLNNEKTDKKEILTCQ